MKYISIKDALKPSGHYSQAIIHNDLIYVSNQLSINPYTGEKQYGTVEDETRNILMNIERILKEADSDKNHVIKTTVYLTDISQWDNMNRVYSDFFGRHTPARTVISVCKLHFKFKVGIEVIASICK